MKIKNKGKVYPSPPQPPSSSSSLSPVNGDGYLSVLRLLPAAILVLASALSTADREVLAYLITRSLKTTITASAVVSSAGNQRSPLTSSSAACSSSSSSSSSPHDSKRKKKKKYGKVNETHKPPVFDCDCFDCYTSYWFRWDSSPNRELIHQVIEAFEDHLTSGEASTSQKPKRINGRGKKKEKSGRRVGDKPKPIEPLAQIDEAVGLQETELAAVSGEISTKSNHFPPANSPDRLVGVDAAESEKEEIAVDSPDNSVLVIRTPAETERKGLARKVLPDVLGLFNSRFWSLWNPNA